VQMAPSNKFTLSAGT